MSKNNVEYNEEEDTIIDNEYTQTIEMEEDSYSKQKTISYITEFMSLSLNEKISRYLLNKNICELRNPITLDTLIHYICINDDNYPLIELMKPNSVQMEKKNKLGQTLLHIAVKNKSYKIVKYLIEKGADLISKDMRNDTPLHIAVKNGDYDIVKLLMRYNPKINILNLNNETPMDIAKKMNDIKIIHCLYNSKEIKKERYNILNNNDYLNLNPIKKNGYLNKDKSSNSSMYNYSVNNCSLDTKNETHNQSFKIYKKKIVSKEKKIKTNITNITNKTININKNLDYKETSFDKKNTFNSIKMLSPIVSRTRLVYRKTSPKTISINNLNDETDKIYYNNENPLNIRKIYPGNYRRNTECSSFLYEKDSNKINKFNLLTENYIIGNKNLYRNNVSPVLKIKNYDKLTYNRNKRSELPIHNYSPKSNTNIEGINEIRKVRRTVINNTPFVNFKRKKNLSKEKLLEFLKEIEMQKYGDILISEGFDDINLIINQMKDGFLVLDDILKEIGIRPPGDRAKILIRMQQVSNGFDFDFPNEQVYFKNNNSIQTWLNKEGLSKYINNFINAGYQSLDLLLIQMASKYKISDKILKNDIHIMNDEDRKIILKSLEKNSENYINNLINNRNAGKTYTKIGQKNDAINCIII